MTRNEAIAQITSNVAKLDDEQLEGLAQISAYLAGPTVYSQLSEAEKAKLETAIEEADRGDVVPWDAVSARLKAKLKTAGV